MFPIFFETLVDCQEPSSSGTAHKSLLFLYFTEGESHVCTTQKPDPFPYMGIFSVALFLNRPKDLVILGFFGLQYWYLHYNFVTFNFNKYQYGFGSGRNEDQIEKWIWYIFNSYQRKSMIAQLFWVKSHEVGGSHTEFQVILFDHRIVLFPSLMDFFAMPKCSKKCVFNFIQPVFFAIHFRRQHLRFRLDLRNFQFLLKPV